MGNFYRGLLKRSWEISWKYKWLWLFGFFATLLGNGTFYESVLRGFTNLSEGRSIFYTIKEYVNSGLLSIFSWTRLLELWETDSTFVSLSVLTLITILLILAIFIVMSVVSQIAIIKSAVTLDEKKKITKLQAFRSGMEKFWPVFWLNVITRVLMFGMVLIIAFCVSLFLAKPIVWSFFLYIFAFLCLLLLGIIIYFITIYAGAFIVLRDKKVWTALRYSWYIFRSNALLNFEFGLLLFFINVLVGIIGVVIAVFAVSPFILLYFLMIAMHLSAFSFVVGFIILGLVALIMVLIGSWFTTFNITSWSLLFEELALKNGKAKLLRIIDQWARKPTSAPKKKYPLKKGTKKKTKKSSK